MKKLIITTFCIMAFLTLTACGKSESKNMKKENNKTEQKQEEPLNLYGVWKQTNSDSKDDYQEAEIKEDGTITINWITEDTKSLYWAGSFDAPNGTMKSYSWISKNDTSQTENAILASSDETKDFKYENGILSYEASAMGVTKTIKMEKIKKD